jgi:broad specificity phosphatase PhoE
MKILDNLPKKVNNKKIAWIIRHAEREENQDKLTEQGRKQAAEFGKSINHLPVNAIYTSPTDRCVETAKIIAEQLPGDVPIILDNYLNEVGVYVTDMQKAIETYYKLGKEEFFKRLFTDQPLEGYNIYSQAAEKLLNFVRENTFENGITLFITHNFIIRMLNHYLRKLTYKDKVMKVGYLQGIIVQI